MILTLTPNPSLDLAYELDALSRGEVQRSNSLSVEAGGKGINVSRNLVANGLDSRAIAPVGGPSGEQFLSLLEESGIELIRVPVAGAVRMNVGIVEKGGAGTKINAQDHDSRKMSWNESWKRSSQPPTARSGSPSAAAYPPAPPRTSTPGSWPWAGKPDAA